MMPTIQTEISMAESKESLHRTAEELEIEDPELEAAAAAIREATITVTTDEVKNV